MTRHYRTFSDIIQYFVGQELSILVRGQKRPREQTRTVGSVVGVGAGLEKDTQCCGTSTIHSHLHKTKFMLAIKKEIWVAASSHPASNENCVVMGQSENHSPTYRVQNSFALFI